MYIIILNIIGAIIIAVTVLIVSNKIILKRALNKFIVPDLTKKGLKLNSIQPAGFLQKGQFKKEKIHLRPFTLGYPVYNKYYNLEYSSVNDESGSILVTARISVAFFFVYKIEYSHPLN